MPGFRGCYRLFIQVLKLLVKFPLLWIWNYIRNQMFLRPKHRAPVENENQEGKLSSLFFSDSFHLVAVYEALC